MKQSCVFFKKDEIHQKAKIGLFIIAYFHDDGTITVAVDDLSKAKWQAPYGGTIPVGNPKVIEFKNREEFDKVFYIPNKMLTSCL